MIFQLTTVAGREMDLPDDDEGHKNAACHRVCDPQSGGLTRIREEREEDLGEYPPGS